MTDTTTVTPEQYQQALAVQAAYDRQEQERIAKLRQALYEAIKPIVESEEFVSIHQQISAIRDSGPKDDYFFSLGVEAVYNGMTNLGVNVANWVPPVTAPAPVVTPTPTTEGSTDGE